jgi:hypothetical protein
MDFTNATCVKLTERGMKNYWLSDSMADQLKARTLCRNCPVQIDCAIYAAEMHVTSGVWAGQSFGTSYEQARKHVKKAHR